MLVGRERERQELERVLATARSGRSAVLALVGEPGIGKTALLELAEAEAGRLTVLRARGIDSEAHVPFGGLLELLRPALGLLDRIPPPQAAALESALALRPGATGERFAVGAATLSLLAAFAETSPVLLLVDDAHSLDRSSSEALLFALRRLLAEPIAAILTVREGEPSLLDGSDLPTLSVGGVDRDAAAALVGDVPQDVAERLYRATAGNPLALLELRSDAARLADAPLDMPVPVSARISSAFLRRAEALPEDARRALVLASASDSGDAAVLERAAASLAIDRAALDAAETAGLVRRVEGRLEFRHPLARAAVYGAARVEERRAAHRALATALPDRELDRRAWHLALAAAGADDAASSALEQAGARARERSAHAVAAAAFERSARLAQDDERRGRLLFAAANAAWLAGNAERTTSLLEEARATGGAADLLVRMEHLRGLVAARQGPVMEGFEVLSAAAEPAAEHDIELAVTMLAQAVDAAFFAGAPAEMLYAARRARELLPADASVHAEFLVTNAEGMAFVFGGEGERGIEAFRRCVELAESSVELRSDPRLLSWLVVGPLWLREADAGRALIETALETARAQAALGVLPALLERVARDHAAAKEWATAEVEFDEAIRLARETGQRTELAAGLAGLAWLEARQGREQACRAHAEEARTLSTEFGIGLYETWAIRALGELELALARPAEAALRFEEETARLRELGIGDVDTSPAAELVEAYLRLGRADDAAAKADEFEAQAAAKGQPWSLARSARCRGLLADEAELKGPFEEAIRLHERTPDAFETARTRLAYGARLRRVRRRVQAREQLRAALDTFDRLGAEPWSELARAELEATGETARRRDPSTADALTPQELQIAQLLAGGKTTREAAAALFLSPKTIEYHLRHVYRKLDVASRPELAARLSALRETGEA